MVSGCCATVWGGIGAAVGAETVGVCSEQARSAAHMTANIARSIRARWMINCVGGCLLIDALTFDHSVLNILNLIDGAGIFREFFLGFG